MRPVAHVPTPRIGAAPLPAPMELSLAIRGGRAFAARGAGGDVVVTLPDAGGVATVLVPRGFGHPLPARRLGAELRAEPNGEPCAPARWVPTGGVAAWLRAVPAPRGPTRVVPPLPEPGAPGAWVVVRPVATAWSAARLVDPAAGHGPVVVADRWVRGVSPAARARGVVRGMSLALARRRCPELVVRPVRGTVGSALAERLGEWLGGVTAVKGGFVGRLSLELQGVTALDRLEHLARRAWQELGVELRVAAAGTREAALGLARLLEPGWVAVTASGGDAAWAGRPAPLGRGWVGPSGGGWQGSPLPDLEGAAVRAALIAGGLRLDPRQGDALVLRLRGARGRAVTRIHPPAGIGRAAFRALVESLARSKGAMLGPIERIDVRLVSERRVTPDAEVPVPAQEVPEGVEVLRTETTRRRARRSPEGVQMALLP